jgi:hypothetical protein
MHVSDVAGKPVFQAVALPRKTTLAMMTTVGMAETTVQMTTLELAKGVMEEGDKEVPWEDRRREILTHKKNEMTGPKKNLQKRKGPKERRGMTKAPKEKRTVHRQMKIATAVHLLLRPVLSNKQRTSLKQKISQWRPLTAPCSSRDQASSQQIRRVEQFLT